LKSVFFQHLGNLVDAFVVPVAPLGTIDGAEVAIRVGPFVPDSDFVVVQILDVGVATEQPHLLSGSQNLAKRLVETGHLPVVVNMGVLGLNYGMQAAQFTATSTTAECQTLSNPMYVHSIPNNNDNQDIVSMGTNSALIAKHIIENSFQVMAIMFMSLAQAVDILNIQDKMATVTKAVYDDVRAIFPAFSTIDSPLYKDIENVVNYLKTKKLNF